MSYSFDGVDDVLTVSPGDTDNERVTFFATGYPTSYGENGGRGHFFAQGGAAEPSGRYHFYFDDNTSGSFQALAFATHRATAPGRWRANYAVALNQWQSFAVTYDNALTANDPLFYRNSVGVAVEEVATPSGGADIAEPQTFYLGNNSGQARTFAGWIGVLAMWNRILHPSEVALVHHCGVRKVLRGLQLWYRGTLLGAPADWTGRGRTLSITGALVDSGADGDRLATA